MIVVTMTAATPKVLTPMTTEPRMYRSITCSSLVSPCPLTPIINGLFIRSTSLIGSNSAHRIIPRREDASPPRTNPDGIPEAIDPTALIVAATVTVGCSAGPVLCVDTCLLYTSDAADEEDSVDLGGRRIIKKKKKEKKKKE
eukprot:TRINITY_DN16484_c0_g1_i2.p2 TRINITY_DN16484_c0_g1~~TRINITY_DN16484_c0_g1_i2.p2  ORF type:complete len:142 (-),score=18.09 TRINITY_DN16484_c0_g1_i2:101-526(-)